MWGSILAGAIGGLTVLVGFSAIVFIGVLYKMRKDARKLMEDELDE